MLHTPGLLLEGVVMSDVHPCTTLSVSLSPIENISSNVPHRAGTYSLERVLEGKGTTSPYTHTLSGQFIRYTIIMAIEACRQALRLLVTVRLNIRLDKTSALSD